MKTKPLSTLGSETPIESLFRSRQAKLIGICLLCTLFLSFPSESHASDQTRFRDTYQLDELGNAKIVRELKLSASDFARLKKYPGDPLRVMQMVSSQTDWHEYEIIDARFDIQNKSVVVELGQKGFAKTIGTAQWQIKSRAKPGSLELITCQDDRIILHGVLNAEFGLVSATIRIKPPAGATSVAFDEKQSSLQYTFAPKLPKSDGQTESYGESDWQLESTSTLMACLAKAYGEENFDDLWTTRSVFNNATGQTLTNFRIRFRVEGLGFWGPWQRTPIVYPNQTLVHGYFPVLDVDALSQLTTKTKTRVVAEIEYQEPSGESVKQVRTQSVDVWPRNSVSFHRQNQHNDQKQVGNNLALMIIASFNAYSDPAIQQLAGRISGMANGPSSSLDTKAGLRYIVAAHKFLQANKFRYHTTGAPLGGDGKELKISYPRNCIETKSFNELDHAIFWASIANAVGMDAKIIVGKENACAIIYLADGQGIPIAGTDYGKDSIEDAVKAGREVLAKTQNGFRLVVDTRLMESNGIRPLELGRFDSRYYDNHKFAFPELPEPKAANTAN